MSDVKRRLRPLCLCLLALGLILGGVRPADAALARKGSVNLTDAYNPQPADDDIVLPMPCGLSMVFKLVAVPAKGFLWDMPVRLSLIHI